MLTVNPPRSPYRDNLPCSRTTYPVHSTMRGKGCERSGQLGDKSVLNSFLFPTYYDLTTKKRTAPPLSFFVPVLDFWFVMPPHSWCAVISSLQNPDRIERHSRSFLFLFCHHRASAPITSGTHTEWGAVIRKPGSTWLKGTPAMDLGHLNVVLKWTFFLSEAFLGFEDPT